MHGTVIAFKRKGFEDLAFFAELLLHQDVINVISVNDYVIHMLSYNNTIRCFLSALIPVPP